MTGDRAHIPPASAVGGILQHTRSRVSADFDHSPIEKTRSSATGGNCGLSIRTDRHKDSPPAQGLRKHRGANGRVHTSWNRIGGLLHLAVPPSCYPAAGTPRGIAAARGSAKLFSQPSAEGVTAIANRTGPSVVLDKSRAAGDYRVATAGVTAPQQVAPKDALCTIHSWRKATPSARSTLSPPTIRLRNPANQCYIDSVTILLSWSLTSTGMTLQALGSIGPAVGLLQRLAEVNLACGRNYQRLESAHTAA